MKLTAIILLSACLTASAKVFSQKVTLSAKDAPLETVIQQIKKQTGYSFFYNVEWLEKAKTITIDIKNVDIEKALDIVFNNQPLSYKLINSTIVLELKSEVIVKDETFLNPPPITVRGRVVNEKGEPVIATVLVKGTQNGTTSNADGYFELKNVDENAILVISGVSIETKEVKVNGNTSFAISIKTKVVEGGEVMIKAGYYDVKKKEMTGNISRVDAKIIEKQPVLNPLQAIQGRMSGVYVQQTTGVPGGGFIVQIRGRNSLRDEGNYPLYIIDGVPFSSSAINSPIIGRTITKEGNPLSTVNPTDILSIEVLKDADATAIYGSRGANGVVLITTKKGKTGKLNIDFNFYAGAGKVASKVNLLTTQQYISMRREAFKNDNRTITIARAPDLLAWDTTRQTDWQKELIGGTANTTNASITVSGGSSGIQYSVGGNFYYESTIFPGKSDFKRGSANLSINHISENKRFQASASVIYSASLNSLFGQDLTFTAITLPPNAPALYDSVGNINWNWKNSNIQNPLAGTLKSYRTNTDNLVANGIINIEILKGVRLKASMGYTKMNVSELLKNPISAIPPQFLTTQTGSSNFGNSYVKTWIIEPQIDYNKGWRKAELNFLIGASAQSSKNEGQTISASGYTNDALLDNLLASATNAVTNFTYSQYRYAGVYGRLNFKGNNKYILNITGRRDGSSRFGPENQFANFGAIGSAWIFSNENFFKEKIGFVSFGKIRLSYGTTGSDNIGDYQYLRSFVSTTYPYNGTPGLVLSRLNNPDFSWEINKKVEAGLELGLFKDRLAFILSWYKNRSSNQLIGLPLPLITGQASVQSNFPATVENRGIEIEINSVNINSKHFKWTTGINFTAPKNKLINFLNIEAFPVYNNIYQVGRSLYVQKTLSFAGVNPTTGLYSFNDIDQNGSISIDDDGLFLKEKSVKYFGGVTNNIAFNGFELDIFIQFVNQVGDSYIRTLSAAPGSLSNQPLKVLERWQKAGDLTNIQKFTQLSSISSIYNRFSDNAMINASFIRIKNISISWTVPEKVLQKLNMKSAKVYFQGQNIATFTNYDGLDPETQSINFLPPLRMLVGGVKISL